METLDIQRLKAIAVSRTVGRGEHLFFEGDPSEGFFAVASGLAKIYKMTPDGREQVLRLVGPGECFAESSIFGDKLYPANAEALQPSEVWLIPKAPFLALIRAEPGLALELLSSMAEGIKRLVALVETLTFKDVNARLADYLLASAPENDRPGGGNISFSFEVEKKVIAAHLGTVSETLSRSLRNLKDRGFIREEDSRVLITDVEGLQKVAVG